MILVCGEALIDLFVDMAGGATARSAIPARAVPGGSPMNVAIGLSRLGVASSFFGGLSDDGFGQRLAALLESENVSLEAAPRLARRTTISVVVTDGRGHPAYSFYGEGGADVSLDSGHLPARLPEAVRAITFGSYSMAVDPAGAAYLALARREAGARVVSVDANFRPTVTPDCAAWRARFHDFVDCASLVKASDEDIASGYGAEAKIDRVAADWLARGAKLVVVTRGPNGSSAYGGAGRVDAPGRPVKLVDTVGAGDTVHAALLARLTQTGKLSRERIAALDEAALRDLLDYANAAAAITCSREGADLPTAEEVARLI
jgi:fructokinase